MEKNLPQHIGIIMDGNRRWAKERGLPAFMGHREGVQALKRVGGWCIDNGVKFITVWVFSTENWSRPKEEVSFLMKLIKEAAIKELNWFLKRGTKLNIIGRLKELPQESRDALENLVAKTKNNDKVTLSVGINYGGQAEIIDAVKKIIKQGIKAAKVTEEVIRENLYAPDVPYPDLIIRTSGEQRTSGFLLWEAAYSEYYFTQKHWPDFSGQDMEQAVADYQKRKRRFGGK